jgi:hypothetical protein
MELQLSNFNKSAKSADTCQYPTSASTCDESIQAIEIKRIITDILCIYETYPIFDFVVKS